MTRANESNGEATDTGGGQELVTTTEVDLTSPEFQDYDGDLFPSAARYSWHRLWSPTSLRGIAAMVVAIFLISGPSESPRLHTLLVAAILIVWSAAGAVELIRSGERNLFTTMKLVTLAGVAIMLLVWPRLSAAGLGRAIGVALVLAGLVAISRAILHRSERPALEASIGGIIYILVGAALLISPSSLLRGVILAVSVYWFVAGVLTVSTNVRDDTEIRPAETWRTFFQWVALRPNTADDRLQLYSGVFYDGPERARRLSRFFTLMGFATVIATYGIISDSTAVVIGAMLVAPLMTPLMGTSLALVMGWPRRALMTALVAVAGIAFAIGLAIIFGWANPGNISPVLNSQVASRITPTLVDLVIAIAAGGAGAFALSRPDVSDSLPGVAVAIALVPPLAVVGLMMSQNNWSDALGALLLFTTNLVAILLMGALVFVLTGVVPIYQITQNSRTIKLALGLVGALAVVIIAALGVSTTALRADIIGTQDANEAVATWLDGTGLEAIDVSVTARGMTVTVAGKDPPPPVEDLAGEMKQTSGRDYDVTVLWVPRTKYEYDSPGTG